MINDSHLLHISLFQMNGIWILKCKTYAEHLIRLPMAQKYYKFKNTANTKFAAWVFPIYKPVSRK